MTAEQNLANVVNDYITQAKGLEITRQALVERIMGVVKAEIIPEISQLLPYRYSIDPDRSSVIGVGEPLPNSDIYNPTHDTVPTGFSVNLRLLYDGKPIHSHTSKDIGKIEDVRRELKPMLELLAERYNLESIMPSGEPGRMI